MILPGKTDSLFGTSVSPLLNWRIDETILPQVCPRGADRSQNLFSITKIYLLQASFIFRLALARALRWQMHAEGKFRAIGLVAAIAESARSLDLP